MERGKLIVVEGSDGSGKQTQSKLLMDKLNFEGRHTEMVSFPRYGDTPSGKMIKMYLGKEPYNPQFGNPVELDPKVSSSWYALDRAESIPYLTEALSRGNVIADRYSQSNLGHQGSKFHDPVERDAFFDWADWLEYDELGIPRPDKVVFLYVPADISVELRKGRGEKEDGHEADRDHLRRTEETYKVLVEKFRWSRIDCAPDEKMRSIEDISNEVYNLVVKDL